MSQQTSMYQYYKVVSAGRQQTDKKSPIVIKTPREALKQKENSLEQDRINYPKQQPAMASLSENRGDLLSTASLVDRLDSEDEALLSIRHLVSDPKPLSCQESFNSSSASTPTKNNVSQKRALSSSRRSSSMSPRKKSQNTPVSTVIRRLKHRSPRKLIYDEAIDTSKVSEVVEILNLARTGVLPKNNFFLSEVYRNNDSEPPERGYIEIDDTTSTYCIDRVNIPNDKHAEHMFNIIVDVFANSINCGYFDDNELDRIFDMLTMSQQSQALFVRMLLRTHVWKRRTSIKYPEIAEDLNPLFDELEENNFFTSDTNEVPLENLLTILSASEVHDVARQSNIPRQKTKESAIEKILRTSSTQSLFPGRESPATVLRRRVLNALGPCTCLLQEMINLVERIITLFIPAQEITATLSSTFLQLTMIKDGSLRYPEVQVHKVPVFQNRDHLVRYVDWKQKWKLVLELPRGDPRNWDTFRRIGRDAHSRLMFLLQQNPISQTDTGVPRHVQKFSEEYVCMKIVTSCLEIFKKERSYIPEAVKMLNDLINQETYCQSRKGEWYDELALIKTKYNKNLNDAARIIIKGLTHATVTEIGKHVLTKRASMLAKRKNGINRDVQSDLKGLINPDLLREPRKVSIHGKVMQGNKTGRKTTWKMDLEDGDKGYMGVEQRAVCYYKELGYIHKWHCEGSFPVTLFALLMWEELYTLPIRGTYLSMYQRAPLDLYTSEFYTNRKEEIDRKIEFIKILSEEQLCSLIETSLETRSLYESIMPKPLAVSNEQFVDLVRCMGPVIVAGICKRMGSNFSVWKAGFPDLVIWDPVGKRYKIVEVKGPGDTLSPKQTLWMRYLKDLGADIELCEIKSKLFNYYSCRITVVNHYHNHNLIDFIFLHCSQSQGLWYRSCTRT
ncbi:fanconi-associated nuclease 1-like isoform X1 [Neodiprion virginianus]|uniref:fanconi-associated nuclease 1-like isoform X1 n=1 Tax=Neodiprion virginianus TaxID=2961670 RepID=UPI001EE69BAF|nr:fanconi-associated nuclease 1-like isoform X1 [Neodiprion virginianus]XP_046613535.1 fanconi-associated nuclease 1-like isoform X1 [Neodiprion virginianus]